MKYAMFETLAGSALLLAASQATAGSITYDLVRASLTNVTDAAGLYQQEGGTVFKARMTSIRATPAGASVPFPNDTSIFEMPCSPVGALPARSVSNGRVRRTASTDLIGRLPADAVPPSPKKR